MTDMNDSDDTTSTDTSRDLRVMNIIPDPDIHDYQKVDQTHLLSVGGCTAYEFSLKCQNEACSQEANPVLAQGDLPVTTEEEEDLAYDLYRWFYDNSDDLPPSSENSAFYIAPLMMIPGDWGGTGILIARASLLVAALQGKGDGKQNRPPAQKSMVISDAKRSAHSLVQNLKDR